jgi:hypothetical protein
VAGCVKIILAKKKNKRSYFKQNKRWQVIAGSKTSQESVTSRFVETVAAHQL